VHRQDVVFVEIKYVVKQEVLLKEEELEKIEFEFKGNESESIKEKESEEEYPHTPVMRRSVRERIQPEMYNPPNFCLNFTLIITEDDPRTVREVVDSEDGKLWEKAMVEEMVAFDKNEAWDLMELSTGRNPIGRKLMFKKKLSVEEKVEKYNAQLVAKGYSQVE
jgi:hypothetical protein